MRLTTTLAIAVALVFSVTPAIAGKGGNNNAGGPGARDAASCSVDGLVVTGVDLPTDELVNFMVTDDGGTWGWVLGYTSDGSWRVSVAAPTGATTYEFVSRTRGPSGSKYDVFARCSV
jgi:hypothetical protein